MKKLMFMASLPLILIACDHAQKNNPDNSRPMADSAVKYDPSHSKNDQIYPADTTKGAKIKFAVTSYNMGVVLKSKKVKIKYVFTNTGRLPLIISTAIASCGCTKPYYPHKSIAPGANGAIEVVFDSSDYTPGKVAQDITIFSNAAPGDASLQLIGEVKASLK
jgi:hypothetical protein